MPDRFTNRYVSAGFIAAVVATILGSAVSPYHPVTVTSVFARAVAYIALVFSAAAFTTYLAFLLTGEGRTVFAKEIATRTGTVALWLAPLLMFSVQRSWFVLVIWPLLVIEVARLIAFLRGMLHSREMVLLETPEDRAFTVLKQDFPFGSSILGALMIQGALFSAVGGYIILAGLLYSAGTIILAYRSFQMFQQLSVSDDRNLARRTSAVLASTTLLIIFAWLPYVFVPGGGSGGTANSLADAGTGLGQRSGNADGVRKTQHGAHGTSSLLARLQSLFGPKRSESHGNSFAIARRFLESSFPQNSNATNTHLKTAQNTNIATAIVTVGPVFPGVELYPDVQPRTKLVAPTVSRKSGTGAARSDPLNIPFGGVYWFWRGPSDRPPLNSVMMHGSPAARFFRSTDGDGISMEAQQNLGFTVDPKLYGAIEIDINNTDPFPNSVSIVLKVRNTTIPGKPIQSLGVESVPGAASSAARGGARSQTLRFRIPTVLAMGIFDELTVSYFLKGARSDRSARIAIERFRLVPR